MKKNIEISAILLTDNKSFNNKLIEFINEKNIPIDIGHDLESNDLETIDIVMIDKRYYLKFGLDKLYEKTKYIIYLIDGEDYNNVFIKELYEHKVFDTINSCFIQQEIEGKLLALVKLISEEDTNQLLDIILDSIEDSIAITDKEGALEYVNKGFLKTTGYKLDEVIGENPRILKSDGHTAGFYNDLWNSIERNDVWRGDFINVSKSGELIYEAASVYPIELSSRKYLKIAHNITKERFLENKVKLSISLAKKVLETSLPSNYIDANMKFDYFIKYMNAIGGDFIWFKQISTRKYILVLIDVTGHDLSSALILMTVINYIKDYKASEALGNLVKKINKYLNDINERTETVKLISGIFCIFDTQSSTLEYINAGHPSGLLFEKEDLKLVELKRNTMLLGVINNMPYETIVLPINRPSDLILYSDGLLESYIEDYSEIDSKTYRNIFYEGNYLKFEKIKEELMTKEHIKDDLSLAHINFQTIGETDVS